MTLLALVLLFVVLLLAGSAVRRRCVPGKPFEECAQDVFFASMGLASAIVGGIVGLWFVVAVAQDDPIKDTLRRYTPPGGGVETLLIAIVVGSLIVLLRKIGEYRAALTHVPKRGRNKT